MMKGFGQAWVIKEQEWINVNVNNITLISELKIDLGTLFDIHF